MNEEQITPSEDAPSKAAIWCEQQIAEVVGGAEDSAKAALCAHVILRAVAECSALFGDKVSAAALGMVWGKVEAETELQGEEELFDVSLEASEISYLAHMRLRDETKGEEVVVEDGMNELGDVDPDDIDEDDIVDTGEEW